MKICTFFGHRDLYHDLSGRLDEAIRCAIREHGVSVFWYGGNGQFDFQAARAVKRVQMEYPHIQLELVRSCLSPSRSDQSALYDSSLFPEGLEYVPPRFAISRRNRWMTARCDVVICYVDHSFGGAYTACMHAKKRGIPIINTAPNPFHF